MTGARVSANGANNRQLGKGRLENLPWPAKVTLLNRLTDALRQAKAGAKIANSA